VPRPTKGVIPNKLRLDPATLLLAASFIVFSCSTIVWTLSDKTPPAWDPSDHLRSAYDYYCEIAHLDFAGFVKDFFVEPHYYAPLVHLVNAVIFLIAGASKLSGILVNLASLAGLLIAVRWMGNRLYAAGAKTAWIGVGELAALLVASYHFPAWLLHDAFLDFPLTAIVVVGFASLIRAGDFHVRRHAVAFGITAGLGMLTKQTFAFFFILPALYVLFLVLRARNPQAILNLALAALIAVAISAIWYVPHFNDVITIYRLNQQAAVKENEAPLLSFMSNVFYLHGLVSHQMQAPLALLFVGGFFYSLVRHGRESVMLYLWLASGITSFTLIANKDLRYTVPVLPAAALISVCWLGRLNPLVSSGKVTVALKLALAAIIVAWSLVSFFNAQWPRAGSGFYVDTPRFRWMVFARNYFGFDHRPLPDDWGVPAIVRTVAELGPTASGKSSAAQMSPHKEDALPAGWHSDLASNGAQPTLGVVINLPYLNPSSIALYARLMARERAGPPLIEVRWLVDQESRNQILECDYLLVRTGLDRAEWIAPLERCAEELISSNPSRFAQVASFPIPLDGVRAVIYKYEK
jgi:4-amino-4-deoxy-L-arabinose transferase-like glycosyltransferase